MLQTLKMKLQKGVILFNPKTKLSNGSIRGKFFIVMEEQSKGRKSLIIFMTTSRRARSLKRDVPIKIPFPRKGEGTVLLGEYRDVPIYKLNRNYSKKAKISDSEIKVLEKAVRSSTFLPIKIKGRVLHKEPKKPKRRKTRKYQWFEKSQIEKLKKRLRLIQKRV